MSQISLASLKLLGFTMQTSIPPRDAERMGTTLDTFLAFGFAAGSGAGSSWGAAAFFSLRKKLFLGCSSSYS